MNLLSEETSPYLLQHASHPVAWHAWNAPALALAKQTNVPILLSIGYSACHWCHVMAHESFEDNATAELMNQWFINIKVDREERPDLDKIYQTAHSMLTQRPGGWPLTLFLTPQDHMPFFAGTYFPPEPRYGMPSFRQLLERIHAVWDTQQTDIEQQNHGLRTALASLHTAHTEQPKLHAMPLDIVRRQIEQQFDARNGGFSDAPKFPHPAIIQSAINLWVSSRQRHPADARMLHCAIFTLARMASGGIFDHLGGGFCRYSTDDKWMIPHFEKMLYDNGPLLSLCAQAYCITGDAQLYDTALETGAWAMREMQSPEGGYYSALDADSEGEEGRFYLWHKDDIAQLLETSTYTRFARRYGLDRDANFEDNWHLHAYMDYATLAEEFNATPATLREILTRARQHLFSVREKRAHPALDDKIITSWNGLMIEGMADAGRLLTRPDFIDSARRAADFIHGTLWHEHRLFATTRNGITHINAYLDDYAFMLNGVLALLQADWSTSLFNWACELADALLLQFEAHTGGFYFTSHDHEPLIHRTLSFADDAMPSGNGVAARALLALGYLSGEARYLASAENCLKAGWQAMREHPISHCSLLEALQDFLNPPDVVILKGDADECARWQALAATHFAGNTRVYSVDLITGNSALDDKTAVAPCSAYICTGMICQHPLTSAEQFREYIARKATIIDAD